MAFELVKDLQTREPFPEAALKIVNRARDYGLIIIKGGNFGNVIRLAPPYCINKNDVKFLL